MTGTDRTDPTPKDPTEEMLRLHLMGGPWIAQSIYVASTLGVADHLGDKPTPVTDLAKVCEAHEGALYRFCRTLAALGVLREHPDRAFSITPMGATLRSDAPRSLRWGTMLHGSETFRAWADVMHTVRTGRPAFEHVFGEPFFAYLETHPELNEIFNKTMGVTDSTPSVLDEYDFSGCEQVVDLGGGIGTLLAAVLRRQPTARGVLQDLPSCVTDAPAHLAEQGVRDRCEIVAASFFDSVPQGADTYLLSRVLHNWAEDEALRLLRSVRDAIRPDGRLIVIDHLLPTTDGFHPGVLADLHMLVVLGGQDRTEAEMRALLEQSGFRVNGVRTSQARVSPRTESLIEALPAD
ncbi:methyltransferase [Micromonospora sp. NPDC049101]|uniref:methyltransferase n=1 Tax=unclassified Micromonospora TaxID=2617518 RepID=UPI003407F81E